MGREAQVMTTDRKCCLKISDHNLYQWLSRLLLYQAEIIKRFNLIWKNKVHLSLCFDCLIYIYTQANTVFFILWKCQMTNVVLSYFIAHIVRTAKIEAKHLVSEARGYKFDIKTESDPGGLFLLREFRTRPSQRAKDVGFQCFRFIHLYFADRKQHTRTSTQTAVRWALGEQETGTSLGCFQIFPRTEQRREWEFPTLKASSQNMFQEYFGAGMPV